MLAGLSKLQRSRVLSNAETPGRYRRRCHQASFNGAAFFRTRKRCANFKASLESARLQRSRVLSNAETRVVFGLKNGLTPGLQRSRVLSNAETQITPRAVRLRLDASTEPRSFERGNALIERENDRLTKASTEPRSFERGNPTITSSRSRATTLQRSRVLSNAETEPHQLFDAGLTNASTEPRSFERGNRRTRYESGGQRRASTEPRSFERGNS